GRRRFGVAAAADGGERRMRKQVVGAVVTLAAFVVGSIAVVRGSDGDRGRVEFELTDQPGAWYRNTAGPVGGSNSLAVAAPGTEVRFSGKSHTVHTMTSLLFPIGAENMPFDTNAQKGSAEVVLKTPGLYVFVCKIHPYMLGAV